jgi:hypothetical protein
MLPNAFIGKAQEPTEEELAAELGSAAPIWNNLLERLAADCNIVTQEWNSYSRKAGWSLRLKVKKRNILHLAPCHGAFRVAFVLGDKAVDAARHSTLPRKVAKIVEEGQRYPEGTAVRMDVTGTRDIAPIVKLAAIKLQY